MGESGEGVASDPHRFADKKKVSSLIVTAPRQQLNNKTSNVRDDAGEISEGDARVIETFWSPSYRSPRVRARTLRMVELPLLVGQLLKDVEKVCKVGEHFVQIRGVPTQQPK